MHGRWVSYVLRTSNVSVSTMRQRPVRRSGDEVGIVVRESHVVDDLVVDLLVREELTRLRVPTTDVAVVVAREDRVVGRAEGGARNVAAGNVGHLDGLDGVGVDARALVVGVLGELEDGDLGLALHELVLGGDGELLAQGERNGTGGGVEFPLVVLLTARDVPEADSGVGRRSEEAGAVSLDSTL